MLFIHFNLEFFFCSCVLYKELSCLRVLSILVSQIASVVSLYTGLCVHVKEILYIYIYIYICIYMCVCVFACM